SPSRTWSSSAVEEPWLRGEGSGVLVGAVRERSRRIVVAPDAFKGSLSAGQVARALIRGMAFTFPDGEYVPVPVADGGEGTAQALVDATGGRMCTVTVEGPMGEPVEAFFGIL